MTGSSERSGRSDRGDRPVRSRARRWTVRLGVAVLLAVLAVALLLTWLLGTPGGRDTLLGRVVGLLPPESLTWESVEGSVRGPLVFRNLRYQQGDIVFTAERVLLDPELLPVLGRRLQLDRLEVDGALLQLPEPADEPFTLPRWPEVLPRLDLPLDIRSALTVVDGFEIRQGDASMLSISALEAQRLRLTRGGFSLGPTTVASDRGDLRLSGEYAPEEDFLTTLEGSYVLRVGNEAPPVTLQFNTAGNLQDFTLDLAGNAPAPLSVSLALEDGLGTPTWTLDANSEGFDPGLFTGAPAGEPWRFALQAQGVGGEAQLQGDLRQGELRIGIAPSQLTLAQGRVQAQPLLLELAQGDVRITGEAELEGDAPSFNLLIASDRIVLTPAGQEAGAAAVSASGELRARGELTDWTLAGDAVLVRADEQATVQLTGRGDRERLVLDRLEVDTAGGNLDGTGRLAWSPTLAFELEARLGDFDPGYFLPDYPGAISGQISASGEQGEDGQWRGAASVRNLDGQLRDRPLSGQAEASWNGQRGNGEADLRIGSSLVQVRGGFGDRYDLQARFAPLDLSDLSPAGQGRLQGTLSLRGPAAALDVTAELQGESLAWDGNTAGTLTLSGRLPARGENGAFEVLAQELQLAGFALDRLDIRGSGSQADLRLQAQAEGEQGAVSLAGNLARTGANWRGRLDSLSIAPTRGPALALQDGAAFEFGPDRMLLERSCLVAADYSGRLCASATRNEVMVDGESLPLALLQPWLPADTGAPLYADGDVSLQARLRRGAGGQWLGEAKVDSATGALRLDGVEGREVFGYRDLELSLALAADAVTGTLSANLADEGRVSASLQTGRTEASPLDGSFELDVRDLTWLELFSEDLASPTGRLQGRLAFAGTRGEPAISGRAELVEFAGELPGMGLKLREGRVTLVGNVDGSATLQGSVRSGEGELALDGSLNFRDRTAPLQLRLTGERVTLASTAELYVIASPDVTLRYVAETLEVRGSVVIPEARLDLESLESNVSVSPDVVVVDPIDPVQRGALPLDLALRITLGDEVRLIGFGLDGRVSGSLAFRERPGRVATASGTLDVSGSYSAYGQDLTIERARLGFANSPYDNPTLDIRAEREFDQVTVGVQVRGTARRPETTVVSSPAMETSQALSWLVFGRPLSTTSGNESEQLGAAALALGAGSNLIAQQLGASLGLDEAGVSNSRNLGGSTFTLGKYVSPRLFVSYGVSLIGTGQVLTLKYLLSRGFDITIESGNENAASLNWRTER